MKVLVAHNRYRSNAPSGENRVVDDEIALLRDAGVDVTSLIEESDSIVGAAAVAKAALGPVYAPAGVQRFRRLLEQTRPDVVHLHNVYPLLSPQVVRVAKAAGVPVVQTVHNYRHTCVNGLQFRDGSICTDCDTSRLSLPAVRHGCYRDSRVQTLPMALGRAVHRSTWGLVDRYLAYTPFMADRLRRSGVAPERITVRAAWVADPGEVTAPGRDFVYVGRLEEAKGVSLLLEAWLAAGVRDRQLLVAGSGPLSSAVAGAGHSVVHLGQLGREGVAAAISRSTAVVVPSLSFEGGFPLVAIEAMAQGRPVVVMEGGSAGSVVDHEVGWRLPPRPEALTTLLRSWDEREAARRGRRSRAVYEQRYTRDVARDSLLAAYDDVCRRARRVPA